ncbi:MAG TPA: antibiotic biosynthesis monooxygenase [Bryobacteraceae bacterium]|nr:antibiotic biosynthesis monooxygenase [Bryobacteraceae bacterium]
MTVEYIRYAVADEGRGQELVSAYSRAALHLDAAPECLAYELTQCEEDMNSWTLRIEWRSTDEHMLGFRKGPHFPPFLAEIRGFLREIAEMRHYSLTAVRRRKLEPDATVL